MLVISRKVGERILLPSSNIVLTVLSVKGKQIRVGVSAPADVGVYREELWHEIRQDPQNLPPKG
jgi:carbon storage regulator